MRVFDISEKIIENVTYKHFFKLMFDVKTLNGVKSKVIM